MRSPAVSFFVPCESQAEIDTLWDRLSEDGEPSVCGSIADRFGRSWQIVPHALAEMLADPEPSRVRILDVAALERAYEKV